MGRKGKYSAEEKLKIVEDCINGRDNPNRRARITGIGRSTINRWIAKYKAEGPTAFINPEENRRYSAELDCSQENRHKNGKNVC